MAPVPEGIGRASSAISWDGQEKLQPCFIALQIGNVAARCQLRSCVELLCSAWEGWALAAQQQRSRRR